MNELLDVLLHPGRWAASADELRPSTRLYLSLFVLGVTIAVAFVSGWLTSRWAHRRTGEATSDVNERTITRLRRHLIALILFIGGYLAVEMAPLPSRIGDWLSGVAFVLGAFVCARMVTRLVALLITT